MQNVERAETVRSTTTRLPQGDRRSTKVEVIVPKDPPHLTPDAARALLRLIQGVAARDPEHQAGDTEPGAPSLGGGQTVRDPR